jgi:cytoskeletal protein CcmA (bactofilin family)
MGTVGAEGKAMDESREGSDVSVIGRRARVEGSLTSAGALRIHGHMKGELSVEGEVSVFADSVVEADIRAGSISLGGRVKGNLIAPGAVSLPPQSQVQGDVRAHSVLTHGVVEGNVQADDKVELGPEARVNGDITCRLLVVAEGAVFRGRSIMDER